jgi:hypothetical protein
MKVTIIEQILNIISIFDLTKAFFSLFTAVIHGLVKRTTPNYGTNVP